VTSEEPQFEDNILEKFEGSPKLAMAKSLVVVLEPHEEVQPGYQWVSTLDSEEINKIEKYTESARISPSEIALLFLGDDISLDSSDESLVKYLEVTKLNIKSKIIDRLVLAVVTEYKSFPQFINKEEAFDFGAEQYTRKVLHDSFGKYFKSRLYSKDSRYCLTRNGKRELIEGLNYLQTKITVDAWVPIVNSLVSLLGKSDEINGVAFERLISNFHNNAPVVSNIVETPEEAQKVLQLFGVKNAGLYGIRILFSEISKDLRLHLSENNLSELFNIRRNFPNSDYHKAVDSVLMIPSFNSRYAVGKAIWEEEKDKSIQQSLLEEFQRNGIDVTARRAGLAIETYKKFIANQKVNNDS